jgi:hypothetical protein
MQPIRLMIIGAGFHARRIYIPALMEFSERMPIQLVGVVDLKSQQDAIDRYIQERNYQFDRIYLDEFNPSVGLPKECTDALDALVAKFDITGVIISTEPLAHKAYAMWALRRNLHILMDKPISVRKSQGTKRSQAKKLVDDYNDLLALYNQTQEKQLTAFSINVQRRYDYGFEKVKQLITEAKEKFNVPVTSIQIMHADGTWVFPKEILFQKSHPYCYGYGKCSHSGYHLFDMAWQLYEAGMINNKQPDAMQIFSSFLSPSGFGIDISEQDYRQYFGTEYEPTGLSAEEYSKQVREYGEIDSFSIVRLLKNRENICNISINLLHSSFSKRAWALPNADLYKGNGRVKHSQFTIQQGPFQCVQIHNYQSKDLHDVDNADEFDIGGNNHFDIYVFRNNKMFGSENSFEKISGKDLEEERSKHLVMEKAKHRVIVEFIDFMLGKIDKRDLKSNIDSQDMPVKIMSGIYQSNALMYQGKNPLVEITLIAAS